MRFLLVLFVLVCFGASPAAALRLPEADRETVQQIEAYLNGVRTLKSRFLQATSAGGLAEGMLYISRPGKLRFVYDEAPFKLVADGTWLIYEDSELEQISYLPLESTPAAVLVRDRLMLDGEDLKLIAFSRRRGLIVLTLVQTDHPESGEVTLVFNAAPIALRQWEIVDAQGTRTVVTLDKTETGIALDDDLFRYKDPRHGPNLTDD